MPSALPEGYLRCMGWRLFSAVALCIVLPVHAQFEKAEAVVRGALAKGKPYKAIAKASAALEKKDAPPVFHILRADGLIRTGAYGKALNDAKTAQALLGDDLALRSQFVGAYLGLGMLDSAVMYFSKERISDRGMQGEFYFRMGSTMEVRGSWNEARVLFDEAVQAYPTQARMVRERGGCNAMLGDTAKARVDLDKAVELGPRDAVNYNSRGYYLHALNGHHAQAIVDYDRAIKQDPNYGFAFSNRGWSRYKLGEVDRARKDLSLALRKDPRNAYAYRSLGIIAVETGNPEQGCDRFRSALQYGFTANYGTEVEELMKVHCIGTTPPTVPIPEQKETTAPTDNAPGKETQRNNAP